MIHTQYGCIGKKLPHSFSKIIHEKIGGYSYELCELSENQVHSFMTARNFKAINVTIPYKQTVIPYLDGISDKAEAIGAVNTVVNSDGKLYGCNTDFYGMTALIEKSGISVRGKKVVILGSGGTSKTAFAVVSALGAERIIKVSRSGNDGCITYGEMYNNHTDADVIINTTPVGMYPDIFASPVDIEKFISLSGVIDAVYNPLTTLLVLKAKKLGIPAVGGLYMLTAQAVRAYEIFTGNKAEATLSDRIFSEISEEKKNIVLTGMPGSGKSTVGKLLADKLRREFIDTDDEIEKLTGMSIADYFKAYGEESFRETETQVIKDISSKNGIVIATGGGAILKEENTDFLKMNGTLYLLDRPLNDLVATNSRPLASSVEAIRQRYKERYGIYTATADVIIKAEGNCDSIAEMIESRHFK